MGASIDSVYYNAEFVNMMSVEQLAFVMLHEASHVLMKHTLRGQKKIHTVFNIAADLYINKLLCEEFQIDPFKKPQ